MSFFSSLFGKPFQKKEEFLPRQLPLRRLKPQERPVKGGGKWVVIFLAGTIILSLGFWFYGNLKEGGFRQSKDLVTPVKNQPTPSPMLPKTGEITQKIFQLTESLKGDYGVYVFNLTTKNSYGQKENQIFTAASLIKLPVLLTLYGEAEAGRLNLETKYTLKQADKQTGAGNLQSKPAGTLATYRQLAQMMGKESDNTAFVILRKILGDAKIQETMDKLGMSKTSLAKNETTPADIGLFFRKLYGGSVVTREHRDEILSFLTATAFEDRIPAGVPEGTRVAHKIGNEIGIFSDAGIVFAPKPFILVIISQNALEKEANEALPKITQVVWEFETKE